MLEWAGIPISDTPIQVLCLVILQGCEFIISLGQSWVFNNDPLSALEHLHQELKNTPEDYVIRLLSSAY